MPPARNVPARAGLDLAQLAKMTEPITVYVTRMHGGQRSLVILPPREGYDQNGAGWTADEIKVIDSEIVQVAGGGMFEIQATDSSHPEAITHKWTTHIPTEMYQPMAPKLPGPFDGPVPPHAAWGSWAQPGYQGGWGGGWGGRTPIAPIAPTGGDEATRLRDQLHQQQLAAQQREFEFSRRLDAATPRDDGRLEREREERLRAERAADEARRAAERAADEARHRAEMSELKAMVTSLAQAVSQAQAAPRQSDEVAELKAELRRSEERRQADAALAETNRRMDALMAEIRAKPTGPDPMMMLIVETMKSSAEAARAAATAQAEAAREAARLQTEAAKEESRARAEEARAVAEAQSRVIDIVTRATSAGNIPPLELVRMMQEAGRGAEAAMRTVMGTTTDLLDLHRNATANLLSMAPQGEGVAGRVVGALENAVGTFSEGQQKIAAAQAASQAQVARAQADALMAQAAIEQARAGLGAPPAQPTHSAQPAPESPVVPFTPNPYAPPSTAPLPAGPTSPTDAAPAATVPTVAPSTTATPSLPPLRHGKTDEEWFGLALPQVKLLREEVDKYLAAVDGSEIDLHQNDHEPVLPITEEVGKDGKPAPLGASPFAAADFVVRAVGQIAQAQQAGQVPPGSIPAFDVLFVQQAYPALLDCILPDPVPQEYRAEVVRYLWRHLNGQPVHQDADPPMYGIAPFLMAAQGAADEPDDEPAAAPTAGTPPVTLVPPANGARTTSAPPRGRPPRGNARA